MAQHRSISQRLKKAKSQEAKSATVIEWAGAWQSEQSYLIDRIGKAIARDDFDDLSIALGELRAMSDKKFVALPKVLAALCPSSLSADE